MKKAILILISIVGLLAAVACGSSSTSVPVTQPTTASVADTVVPPTTGPVATEAPEPSGTAQLLSGPLAELGISDALIQSPRGESFGTLRVALHYGFSPTWLDPLESIGNLTANFGYIIQDAMLKPMPQGVVTYNLAELLEMPTDFTKAAFRLRPGLKFHDGTPLTTEDVKFTYETYTGQEANTMQSKLDDSRADGGIQIVDDRVIIFHFKEPFLDFVNLYNGTGSGIGWIVPKAYYEEVGPDGYKEKPIGAGPFKFVKSEDGGQKLTFVAWDGYWRRAPGAQDLTFVGIREPTLRLAGLQTGEIDVASGMTGDIFKALADDPDLTWDPNPTAPWVLWFPGYDEADSPFNDKRVRQAVSLSLNRSFLSQLETEGQGEVWGNVTSLEFKDSIELPLPEEDLDKAKQLLADAGFANGFSIDGLVPFVPYFSFGERLLTDLGAIGISGPLETLEGPAYRSKIGQGREGFEGNATVLHHIAIKPGRAADWIRLYATCDGDASLVCDPVLEAMFAQHEASSDLELRDELSASMQRYLVEEFIAVPIYINTFVHGSSDNVVGGMSKYFDTFQAPFPWPWDDFEVKE